MTPGGEAGKGDRGEIMNALEYHTATDTSGTMSCIRHYWKVTAGF